MRQARPIAVGIALALLVVSAPVARAQAPLEDTDFTAATPRPDPDVIVVREQSYGAAGVDLTGYGIGAGPVDYVQSLYFRFFVDNDASEDATAGRVVLPPGVEILGFIVGETALGGSIDDGVATETDALFGITDPDRYSEASRGFGTGTGNGLEEFVCQTAPNRFVYGLNVTVGVDDFRAIIDYGDSFPQGLTMDVGSYQLGTLGSVPVESGIQVGNTIDTSVPGSGDFSVFGSVLGIPLTANTPAQGVFDLPFVPAQGVYILRDTTDSTRIDVFDFVEQIPWPSRAEFVVRVQNPVGLTDGPDGLLYGIGSGGGYATADPGSTTVVEQLLSANTGDNRDLTNLPGTRDLYVVRNTTGDTMIDRVDVDSPDFVPAFSIPAATLPDPAAITDAADGLLYVLGISGTIMPVDPVTGPGTATVFSPPSGSYVSATGVPTGQFVYLLRDAGATASIDRFDIGSGMVTFDFATAAFVDDAISLTDADNGRLVLIGAGAGPAPWYVEFNAVTGSQIAANLCLDFTGTNASITGMSEFSPATPGEAGVDEQPLLVTDYDDTSGELSILYGVACEAIDHTIHYGPLSQFDLATYNYTGRDCGIGNTGLYDQFAPGSGSYFFLLVADDGSVEGSYGRDSASTERPADPANPTCPLPQDISASCGP